MKEKTCFKCDETKPITEFYVHPAMGDGRLNKCKGCTKRDVSKNYRDNIEHYKEYEKSRLHEPHRVKARKEYAKTPEGKAALARGRRRYQRRYPEKTIARNAVSNAVRDGKLEKPQQCEKCGDGGRIEGHHTDYSKPLDVEWLCVSCHQEVHRSEAA